MSGALKNVTIVGAAGSLGSVILGRLIASGQFNLTSLKRAGSKSVAPEGVKSVEADFTSVDSLKSALIGQDAVVCTVGNEGLSSQPILIDAAASAGVKRFIPSEFGCDMGNPKARVLPVYQPKVKVEEHLEEVCKTSGMTYTSVYNTAFLDWGIEHDMLLSTSNSKPRLFDGGDYSFSTTSLPTIGDAVVAILSRAVEETKNRAVRIQDVVTTQNKLLALAKKAAPERVFEPFTVDVDDLVAKGKERLAQGIVDMQALAPFLFLAVMKPGYGGHFQQTDNELLGLKGKTDEDIIEMFKKHLN